MPKFGQKSLEKLATCHPDLQRLFNEVVKHYDCAILCGHRDEIAQDQAFAEKKSKLQWPNSKHNSIPSMAVDASFYPLDWDKRENFVHFAGFVLGIAKSLNIEIRCGIDFNGDLKFDNDSLFDGPHFELKESSYADSK